MRKVVIIEESSLFQELSDQFFIDFSILLVSHREVQPCFFIYNTLEVRKGIEPVSAVVRSHTAFAKAAKSHLAGCQMDDRIIHTATAESTARGDFAGDILVGSEDIQSQWMCHGVNGYDSFIQ